MDVPKPRDLFTAENLKKFEKPWEEKVPTAFFRGTATGIHSGESDSSRFFLFKCIVTQGGGVTPATNQRLHAALISYEWEQMAKADSTVYTGKANMF